MDYKIQANTKSLLEIKRWPIHNTCVKEPRVSKSSVGEYLMLGSGVWPQGDLCRHSLPLQMFLHLHGTGHAEEKAEGCQNSTSSMGHISKRRELWRKLPK